MVATSKINTYDYLSMPFYEIMLHKMPWSTCLLNMLPPLAHLLLKMTEALIFTNLYCVNSHGDWRPPTVHYRVLVLHHKKPFNKHIMHTLLSP